MLPNIPTDADLTDEQKAQLIEARANIPRIKEQIRRAKAAGIDVSEYEKELAALEEQLTKLISVYVRGGRAVT